jgi:RimJ/RimL family protein N-acetyltransferase
MNPFPRPLRLADQQALSVAEAGPADAADLLTHARAVARESNFLNAGPGERSLTLEAQIAFLRRLRVQQAGTILKGTMAGRLIAVLTLVRPQQPRLRHRAEIGLTVRATHWGQGVGRRMVESAIAFAEAHGLHKLNLRVRADNRRAIRLYQSLGFSKEGLSPRALCIKGRFYSEILMGLCLDKPLDRACREIARSPEKRPAPRGTRERLRER